MTYVLNVTGDKQSIMRTDVLRRFPSPFEDVRGWVSEGLVWNRIGLEYKSRHMQRNRRLRSHANYARFSLHAGAGLREQARNAPSRAAWLLLAPLGGVLYLRDRQRRGARQS